MAPIPTSCIETGAIGSIRTKRTRNMRATAAVGRRSGRSFGDASDSDRRAICAGTCWRSQRGCGVGASCRDKATSTSTRSRVRSTPSTHPRTPRASSCAGRTPPWFCWRSRRSWSVASAGGGQASQSSLRRDSCWPTTPRSAWCSRPGHATPCRSDPPSTSALPPAWRP